jgi:hypothetical protein
MNKSMLCAGLLALVAAQHPPYAPIALDRRRHEQQLEQLANWNNCGGAHALPVDGDNLGFPTACRG